MVPLQIVMKIVLKYESLEIEGNLWVNLHDLTSALSAGCAKSHF